MKLPFTTPTLEARIARELAEARVARLWAQAKLEYYTAMAAMLEQRIRRLEGAS